MSNYEEVAIYQTTEELRFFPPTRIVTTPAQIYLPAGTRVHLGVFTIGKQKVYESGKVAHVCKGPYAGYVRMKSACIVLVSALELLADCVNAPSKEKQ